MMFCELSSTMLVRCGALWLLVMVVAGCGDNFSVHGKITVNGEPLEQAELKFVPTNSSGGDEIGTVVTNGEYSLVDPDRLKETEYQVQIRSFRSTGKKVWDGMGDGTNKNMVEDVKQFIPIKYNDASELRVSLKRGRNEFSTDLKVNR